MVASSADPVDPRPAGLWRRRRRAVGRWSVAVAVYLLAVFHRTSLGVAGLQAADRFHISPSQLSVFALLQLGVYAGMQIPTGVLVDRYGPRRLLVVASLTMGLAQALFAVAGSYPLALLARAVLGLGDALTFVSVLRFAAGQFAPRRYPLIVAATGTLGTVGNVVATLPLTAALHSLGWSPTFLIAGSLSVIAGGLVYLLLPAARPLPGGPSTPSELAAALGRVGRRVRSAWRLPGTRAGFWLHFTAMSLSLMFAVLWGLPFLVQGEGMSRNAASGVLLASVLVAIAVGPPVGVLIGRFPAGRIPLAIGSCLLTVAGWYVLLAGFGRPAPHWLVIGLVLITATGGPVSGIGFALARDYNGPGIVGTATGVVNVAGFVAGIACSLAVGVGLSLSGGTELTDYRRAFAVAVSIELFGLIQLVRWWLRARRFVLSAQARGEQTPVALVRHRWDLG